jgi:hypothetical protein
LPASQSRSNPLPLGHSAAPALQYDLRRMMVFLDALTLNKPEIFIGGCTPKFDDKTGELKDDATRNFIKQQLGCSDDLTKWGSLAGANQIQGWLLGGRSWMARFCATISGSR